MQGNILVHLVFPTLYRRSLLMDELRDEHHADSQSSIIKSIYETHFCEEPRISGFRCSGNRDEGGAVTCLIYFDANLMQRG